MLARRYSLLYFTLLIAPLTLVGCGGKSGSDSGSGSAPTVQTDLSGFMKTSVTGTRGNAFTEATISDPKTFNPPVAKETSSTAILAQVFDGLVTRRPDTLEIEPALAETYKNSPDGKTWTFTLRSGLKWSDGQPVTADDVVFTFDVIYDPKTESSARDVLVIDGKPATYKKIDDRTIEFDLPHAFSPFLDTFGSTSIIPKHKLETAFKAGTFASTWTVSTPPADIVGTGPFTLADYKSGQYVKYRRNPYYWRLAGDGKQLPFLEGGTTEVVPDLNTSILKFKSKETDYAGARPEDWADLKQGESSGDYKTTDAGPNWSLSYLSFNENPHAANLPAYKLQWFSQKEFRQAISYAIDRDAMVQTVLRGLGRPLWSPISEANKVLYNPNVPKYPRDINKAKALLAGLGFVDGGDGILKDKTGHALEFNLLTNTGNNINISFCTMIQENLKQIGIKVNVTPVDFNSLVTRLSNTYDWEAVVLGFTGGPEPYNSRTIWGSSGHLHVWNPTQTTPATPWEAEIDKIFVEGSQAVDESKRKQLYNRFQEIAAEQQPLILLATSDSLFAIRNRLSNTKPTSLGAVRWNLYEISAQ